MKLNELRKMVKTALLEFSAGGGTLGGGQADRPVRFDQFGRLAPFEEPEHEEQSTMTSFADDDEQDRPGEARRSIADVRREVHDLMGAAMETLKAPTEDHQKKYQEIVAHLQVLNQELENLSNAKEKQQQQQ
jgi:hypothetical protein